MIGPGLQRAIYAALSGAGIAGGRIYDGVPDNPVFPYVTIGDEQIIDDSNTCGESWEAFADIHVWSRPVAGSKVEAKTIAAAVKGAVLAIGTVSGGTLTGVFSETARSFRDPDGLTEHTVLTFKFIIEEAE